MAEAKGAAPQGVTVLVTDSDGRQVGTGSCFERGHPGGYTLREAQTLRATNAAWWQAFDRMCRSEVASVINQGGIAFDALRRKLQDQHGWREHVISHGHGDEDG